MRIWQFFGFLLLLARFYWGAYRFNEEQPPAATVPDTLLNLAGTFGLFCLFYVTAINISTLDLFYVFVFVMHILDFMWFFVVLQRLDRGSPLHQPVKLFLLFDIVTFIVFVGLFLGYSTRFLEGKDFSFQWGILASLAIISVVDLVWLRDFYFHPGTWRERHK